MKIISIRHKVKSHRPDLRSVCDLLESIHHNGFCDPIARNMAYLETQGWAVWEKILDTANAIEVESPSLKAMLIKGAILGFLIARNKI